MIDDAKQRQEATQRIAAASKTPRRFRSQLIARVAACLAVAISAPGPLFADLVASQTQRIEVVRKVRPSVVSIFGQSAQGGGSGVLISPDGFALTNFHVVSGIGVALRCGLDDGELYDAVLVGVDPVGDVALIKLLGRDDFPHAPLGDSDSLEVGQPVLAMGNPFLLATDFQPSVSLGIVSGLRRYQYPAQSQQGSLLEYCDCIQTDASINPGNSGGPLFDLAGEVVGVNGRISLDRRGRVNAGVGYAISINQIKNFLDHLEGGLIVDHASLGATATADSQGRVVIDSILPESDAFLQGLRRGDEIVEFDGRPIGSPNQLLNALGTLPKGWQAELIYRRDQRRHAIRPLLSGKHPDLHLQKLFSGEAKPPADSPIPEGVASVYEEKEGFANFHFNQLQSERLLKAAMSDAPAGEWKWTLRSETEPRIEVTISDGRAQWESETRSVAFPSDETDPPDALAVLEFLELYRGLLLHGAERFSQTTFAGSFRDADGKRRLTLETKRAAETVIWFFDRDDLELRAIAKPSLAGEGRLQLELIRDQQAGQDGSPPAPSRLRLHRSGQSALQWDVSAF